MGIFSRIKNPISGTAQVASCSPMPIENAESPCHIQLVVQAPGVAPFSTEQTVDLWPGKWPTPGSTLAVTFDRDHTDRLRIEWDKEPVDVIAAPAPAPVEPAAPAAPGWTGGPAVPPTVLPPTVISMGTGQPIQIGADTAQFKDAISQAEKMAGMDLDGDGTVAGAPAQPGQKLDIAGLMAQAQAAMAAFQQGGMLTGVPGPTATPAASAAPANDTIAELERLGDLRDRGALTDAEFEAQKKRILGGG